MNKIVKLIVALSVFVTGSSFAQNSNLISLHNYKRPAQSNLKVENKSQAFVAQPTNSGSLSASNSSANYKIPTTNNSNILLSPVMVVDESEKTNSKALNRNYKNTMLSPVSEGNKKSSNNMNPPTIKAENSKENNVASRE